MTFFMNSSNTNGSLNSYISKFLCLIFPRHVMSHTQATSEQVGFFSQDASFCLLTCLAFSLLRTFDDVISLSCFTHFDVAALPALTNCLTCTRFLSAIFCNVSGDTKLFCIIFIKHFCLAFQMYLHGG